MANDENAHTDDIMAITISADRKSAASGQVGPAPAAFVWDAQTGAKKQRFKLLRGARGIGCIAMSNDSSLVAMADLSDDHNIYVFEIASASMRMIEKGDT